MFRGLSSTMAREMPGYFFFFGGYEMAKNLLRTEAEEENIGFYHILNDFKVFFLILYLMSV